MIITIIILRFAMPKTRAIVIMEELVTIRIVTYRQMIYRQNSMD